MHSDDLEFQKIDEFVNSNYKRILEIGCGEGRHSSFLAQKTKKLFAIDVDEVRLAEAKRTVKGVDFSVGSGESLDFPEEFFDLVFFGFSLHHQNGSIALSEARRVLAPWGKVLIIEPTVESEYTKLVSVFQKDESALLRRAARDIRSFGMAVTRQEIFVVNHYFDSEKLFLDHYCSSYGNGIIDETSSNELRQIIGGKIFESPIIVEDQCKIMLIDNHSI
jgi:SAM-dependent methyltransferase